MDNMKQLQKETIESIAEYLAKIKNAVNMIILDFQGGREERATLTCEQLMAGFNWIVEALYLTKGLQQECGVTIDNEQVNRKLLNLTEAFKNMDYVLIADLLEYEINPIIIDWHNKIKKVIESEAFQLI